MANIHISLMLGLTAVSNCVLAAAIPVSMQTNSAQPATSSAELRAVLPETVRLLIVNGKPRWKETSAGYTLLTYEGDLLTEEIGPTGKAMYAYTWEHKLKGISYDDGTAVTAKYDKRGQLVALESCSGKTVRFQNRRDQGIVSTLPQSATFQRALAQLIHVPAPAAVVAKVPYLRTAQH